MENTRRESENTEGNFLFDTTIFPYFPQKINPQVYIFLLKVFQYLTQGLLLPLMEPGQSVVVWAKLRLGDI